MKVLVIGAAGMIGKKLIQRLLDENSPVHPLSELILYDIIDAEKPSTKIPVKIFSGDISKPDQAKILASEKPSIIYHLASIVSGEAEENFSKRVKGAIQDIVTFDQMACSSPHIYFFEKKGPKSNIDGIMQSFGNEFAELEKKQRLGNHQQGICSNVINARSKHLLDLNSNVLAPTSLCWTVLTNDTIELEEPVFGRTIFVKEVDSLETVVTLVNRNIQCVSLAIDDEKRREALSTELSYKGVDRFVSPGSMNLFNTPWDGIFLLSRAVRWVSLN